MEKEEILSFLSQAITEIDQYREKIAARFGASFYSDLELVNYCNDWQFIKETCCRLQKTVLDLTSEEIKERNDVSFQIKNLDINLRAIRIHSETLLKNGPKHVPSNPNKIVPR